MGPTPVYGARAEKPPKNADFAMKQTNICRLSGDIIRLIKRSKHRRPEVPLLKEIYLNKKVGNIIWNLLHQQIDDVKYFRPTTNEDRVIELMKLMMVVRLCVLCQGVVPRHFLRHRNDERRRSRRRDQ